MIFWSDFGVHIARRIARIRLLIKPSCELMKRSKLNEVSVRFEHDADTTSLGR